MITACTHCNMKAYSNTFATQFETKLGKPDGDGLSPLILTAAFNSGSTRREVLKGLAVRMILDGYYQWRP